MTVLLVMGNKIIKTMLPKKIYGDYWITDSNIDDKIINIEEENGRWKVKSNSDYQLIDSNQKQIESMYLENYAINYVRVSKTNDIYLLYSAPIFDETIKYLNISNYKEITIGKNNNCDITYKNSLVSDAHAKIILDNGKWKIVDLNSKLGVFVNSLRIKETKLDYGDIIFILGLKIVILKDRIIINNPNNMVNFNNFQIIPFEKVGIKLKQIKDETEENVELYSEDDYFLRAPRFKTSIEKEVMVIDPPPSEVKPDNTPALLLIGSSLARGRMSVMNLFTIVDSVMAGTRTMKSALPSLIGSGTMLLSMILWPVLRRRYQKKMIIKREQERQDKYNFYIYLVFLVLF